MLSKSVERELGRASSDTPTEHRSMLFPNVARYKVGASSEAPRKE